jgi:Trm5-related predicted tRNA methylase
MDKYEVNVVFVVQAPDRSAAWRISREICEEKLKGLATVHAVTEALKDPEEWVAINEKR